MARILVIDDEPDVVRLILKVLSGRGHVVQTARDGASALARVKHEAPDVILLDSDVPKIDGAEVCRRISIDTQLILGRGGDVLELAGGCVCCKVDIKNDLWDGIADIVARSSPDAVVLETTGIAEPAAILDGLIRVPDAVRERIVPAGV